MEGAESGYWNQEKSHGAADYYSTGNWSRKTNMNHARRGKNFPKYLGKNFTSQVMVIV